MKREKLIIAGLLAGIAVVVAIGLSSVRSLHHLFRLRDAQEHSFAIRHELVTLGALLTDVETGQRGYVITGEPAYLDPYLNAKQLIPQHFERLRSLVRDQPNGNDVLGKLLNLSAQRLARVREVIAVRESQGLEPAARLVAEGKGKNVMDQFRREIDRFESEQEGILAAQRNRLQAASGQARWITLLGGVTGVAASIFAFAQVRTGFAERRRANEFLEARVTQRTAELNAALRRLGEENQQRRRVEAQVLSISEREQRRIASDLHDGLGQVLAGTMHLVSALEKKVKERPESREVATIRGFLKDALDQTRLIARGLYPVQPSPGGLAVALADLAERGRTLYRIECLFAPGQETAVADNETATHLYRIAQEALNNAVKHGKAARVEIRFETLPDTARLEIADDGSGIDPAASFQGIGLRIMRDRANFVHGTLRIEPNQPRGTRVICEVPAQRQTQL